MPPGIPAVPAGGDTAAPLSSVEAQQAGDARAEGELAALRQRVLRARTLADLERLQREIRGTAPKPPPVTDPAY